MRDWERWVVYPLCAICALICLCDMSWRIGADKSGFVVGVLAVLVTALVGWQIWQTIVSREEIREMRDNANRIEQRFSFLNTELTSQRESVPHLIEATRLFTTANTIRMVAELDAVNLREAYATYVEAIIEFLQSNPEDFVDRCLAGMERCRIPHVGAFNYTPGHDTTFVERCNRNYETLEGMFNRLTQEQREQIRRLRDIRLKYHNPA